MKTLTVRSFLKYDNAVCLEKFLKQNGIKRVGAGSSRTVYRISPKQVIKIAHKKLPSWVATGAGEAQNKREVQLTNKCGHTGLFAKVIWYHPQYLWVISEYAEPISYKKKSLFLKYNNHILRKIGVMDADSKNQFGQIRSNVVVTDYGSCSSIMFKYYGIYS